MKLRILVSIVALLIAAPVYSQTAAYQDNKFTTTPASPNSNVTAPDPVNPANAQGRQMQNLPQPGMQGTLTPTPTTVMNTLPMVQAEEVSRAEQEIQKSLAALTMALMRLEARVTELRRQADSPSKFDIERLEQDITLADDELYKLTIKSLTGLAELQRSEIQDRLFQLKLSMELLKRRWGGTETVFGMDFFSKAPPAELGTSGLVPSNYVIQNGDTLNILITSKLGAASEYKPVVNTSGHITVPGAGSLRVTGKTAHEVRDMISKSLSQRFSQLKVEVSVDMMSHIQVQVAGEVAKPGTYQLQGSSTVLAALYKAGGPTANGSFRNVQLVREGGRQVIDLYRFLLDGDKQQDALLRDGDMVFVPAVGPTIVVEGQVVRPARYEPDFPITLAQAVKMAGGVKPGGYTNTVAVERVENGEYRVLLDVPVNGAGQPMFQLQPGDVVTVSPVRPDRTNQVLITGPVTQEGTYGFSEGMRVSDLVKLARGLAPDKEVYGGRADIVRIDPLTGTELITFNLDAALKGDKDQDILLKRLDRVFIYSPDQVVFRPMLVTVTGSVAKPGVYKRTGGMRVSDAIAAAGGVTPQAYLTRADLLRYTDADKIELVRVNLQKALTGDPEANIQLHDRDELTIYSQDEAVWADRTVRIEGAVQRAGVYKRPANMRLSDLLFVSGGLLPEAEGEAEVARTDEAGVTNVIKVNVKDLVPQSEQDVLLKDRDLVTVPTVRDYLRTPEVVFLVGEVAKPGPYALLSPDEKISSVIERAGGLTENADPRGLMFLRQSEHLQNPQQEQDVDTILQRTKIFADKQFLIQLGKLGIRMPDSFEVQTASTAENMTRPGELVDTEKVEEYTSSQMGTDGWQVDKDTEAPSRLDIKDVMDKRRKEALKPEEVAAKMAEANPENQPSAMGPALADAEAGLFPSYEGRHRLAAVADSVRISVDLERALKDPYSGDNLPLRNGDRLFIPKVNNVVTVIGAVLHPHVFAADPGKGVSYYIQRSGGYSQEASKSHVVVVRSNGDALPLHAVKFVAPGDTIVVPTTGLIDVAKKWERWGGVTKVISEVLSSVFVLTRF